MGEVGWGGGGPWGVGVGVGVGVGEGIWSGEGCPKGIDDACETVVGGVAVGLGALGVFDSVLAGWILVRVARMVGLADLGGWMVVFCHVGRVGSLM